MPSELRPKHSVRAMSAGRAGQSGLLHTRLMSAHALRKTPAPLPPQYAAPAALPPAPVARAPLPARQHRDVSVGDLFVLEQPVANLRDLPATVRWRAFCRKLRFRDKASGLIKTVHEVRPPPPRRKPGSQQVQQWAVGIPQDSQPEPELLTLLEQELRRIRNSKTAAQKAAEEADCRRDQHAKALAARLRCELHQTELRNGESAELAAELQRIQSLLRHVQEQDHGADRISERPGQPELSCMFDRLRGLCEALWSEAHVSQQYQDLFRQRFYYPETFKNYTIVFREVESLGRRREVQERIHSLIERREAVVGRVFTLAARRELVAPGERGGGDAQLRVATEAASAVMELRVITCDIVDLIYLWREQQVPARPFLWRSADGEETNYIMRMQVSLDGLQGTALGLLLSPEYDISGNPFLLPRAVLSRSRTSRSRPGTATAAEAGRESSLSQLASSCSSAARKRRDLSPATRKCPKTPTPLLPLSAIIPPPKPQRPKPETLLAPGVLASSVPLPDCAEKRRNYFTMWQNQAHELAAHLERRTAELCGREPSATPSSASVADSCEERNVYTFPPEVYVTRKPERTDVVAASLRRLLDPTWSAPRERPADERQLFSGSSRRDDLMLRASRGALRRLMPPTQQQHQELADGTIRLELPQATQTMPVRALTVRDSMILHEQGYLEESVGSASLVRAKTKLVNAFRLFKTRVAREKRERSAEAVSKHVLSSAADAVRALEQRKGRQAEVRAGFAEWVRRNAPSWLGVDEQLRELDDDDAAAAWQDSDGVSTASSSSG